MDSKLQHRRDERDECTPSARRGDSSDPHLEISRWLDVDDAIDEPGDWRVVVRLDDGTEVVGEEIAITIGEPL